MNKITNINQRINKLDNNSKTLVLKFIDFLENENKNKNLKSKNFKKKLFDVSVGSENDLEIFNEIKENFKKWNTINW